jgi:hypothetical protein
VKLWNKEGKILKECEVVVSVMMKKKNEESRKILLMLRTNVIYIELYGLGRVERVLKTLTYTQPVISIY